MSRTQSAIAYAALLVVALVAAVVLPPGGPAASAFVQYVGRLHLLVLHVPIGVLVVVLLGEALTFGRRRETGDTVVALTLPLLVVSGVVAIVLGLCLAHGGDHPVGLATKHRNFTIAGILVAGVAGIAFPYRRGRALHRALLAACTAVLGIGAHFGGSLTHGSDYLFAPITPAKAAVAEDAGAPEPEPADASAPVIAVVIDASTTDAIDAATPIVVVAPHDAGAVAKPSNRAAAQAMLLRRCGPCHTDRTKGGLRVSDIGKMKAADVVAGNPAESPLYARLVLPKDDDDRMPPIDKPQPTAAELAVLRAWISELSSYP